MDDPSFYITGGTLHPEAPSYVERQADTALFESLFQGEYCYVLTARQTGKSSLMVRTAGRLRAEGIRTAVLDLTAIGQNLSPPQWYRGLLDLLGPQLGLEDELEDAWQERGDLGALQRFLAAIETVALDSSLVLFIDEIDAVRSLPFSTDELFAGIRQCYNRRSQIPRFERLTFCLLGVATPSDLIRDTRTTPFNIGRRIDLTDFTPGEALPLLPGLPGEKRGKSKLLERILHWTGGHPYLTQRLCRAAAEAFAVSPPSQVSPAKIDRLCETLFLSQQALDTDDNLAFVRNRLLKSERDLVSLLDLYAQVCRGRRIPVDDTNPLLDELRLSGIVRLGGSSRTPTHAIQPAFLAVRNRIYARAFDLNWVAAHMPDAELRRQRAAYRRGVIRAGSLFACISLAMGLLAGVASDSAYKARQAGRQALGNLQRAEDLTARLRTINDQLQEALREAESQRAKATEAARLALLARERETLQKQAALQAGKQAELQRSLAIIAGESAREQAGIAREQTGIARQRLSASLVSDGLRRLDDGDPSAALLPLTEALRADQGNSNAEQADRYRIAAAVSHAPQLDHIWFQGGAANSASYSPDGKWIATAADDGTVRINDSRTGQEIRRLTHPVAVRDAAIRPDGSQIATVAADNVLRVWRLGDGHPLWSRNLGRMSREVTWSRYGAFLAVACNDGPVVLDAAGKISRRFAMPGAEVKEARFSPDGRVLITVSLNYITAAYSLKSGESIWAPDLYRGRSIGFTPEGRTVLLRGASADGREIGARLYNVETGQPASRWMRQTADGPFALSPDGRTVLAGGPRGARLWSVESGEPVTPPLSHNSEVLITRFSPDGKRALSASADGTVQVWNAQTGERLGPPLRHAGTVLAAEFDRTSRRVLTASADHTVRIWDLGPSSARSPARVPANSESGLLLGGRTLLAWNTLPNQAAFGLWNTASGQQLLPAAPDGAAWERGSCSADQKTVCVWRGESLLVADAASGKPLLGPLRLPRPLLFASLNPDGQQLLVLQKGGPTEIRSARTGALQVRLQLSPEALPVDSVRYANGAFNAFTPDGRRLGLVCADRSVRMWDTATGKPLSTPIQMGVRPMWVAFDPAGRFVVTHLETGAIRFWDSRTGQPLTPKLQPPMLAPGYHKWKFSPDGRLAVAYTEAGSSLRLWNLTTRREFRIARAGTEPLYWAGFSPDARRVAVLLKRTVRMYSTETGLPIGPVLHSSADMGVPVFAPDGRAIALGTADGRVTLWNSLTGSTTAPPLLHPQRVSQICFSPDGRRLATGWEEGSVRLWDARSGEPLGAAVPGPVGRQLEFSPDGRRLFTSSYQDLQSLRVEPELRPLAQLSSLAVLLSGQRSDPTLGFVTAEPEQLRRAWNGLQSATTKGSPRARFRAGNATTAATRYRYGARVANRSARSSAGLP